MRDLLRGYADEGGTVLLSSHLLHEIEVIADDLVVIGNGRIVAQGTKAELLAAAGTYVRARDAAALAAALTAAGHHGHASRRRRAHRRRRRRRSARVALAAGVPLTELRPADGAGLEEMFLELTADTHAKEQRHEPPSSSTSTTEAAREQPRARAAHCAPIPLRHASSGVELRKMFDTRSGFWLMASIAITSVLATGAVIAFAGATS